MQNFLFQKSLICFIPLIRWTVPNSHHYVSLTGPSSDPKLWTHSQTVFCPTEGLSYFWATPSLTSYLPHPLLDLSFLKSLYPAIAITYLCELLHHSSIIWCQLLPALSSALKKGLCGLKSYQKTSATQALNQFPKITVTIYIFFWWTRYWIKAVVISFSKSKRVLGIMDFSPFSIGYVLIYCSWAFGRQICRLLLLD